MCSTTLFRYKTVYLSLSFKNCVSISSCECNKVVSAFLLFSRRGDFVFQALFSDCWKFKRKEKLNRIKIVLFTYDINDLLFLIQNHKGEISIFRWRISFFDLPLNARKSYLCRYDFLAYMQVTAAFARKSYLHLISLITPLSISISIWNLSQNLSLDLLHHNNKRKIASAFNDFPGEAFLCLKFTFDSNFGMFIVLKEKVTITIWKGWYSYTIQILLKLLK